MALTFEFCEPTALAAGIEALFVQGKLFRPTSVDWAYSGPWFASMGLSLLTVASHLDPPLPVVSAIGSQDQAPNPKYAHRSQSRWHRALASGCIHNRKLTLSG